MPVTFEKIAGDQHQVDALYSLLTQRIHNISHQSMPSYNDHCAFIKRNPYRSWFLLKSSDGYIGSVYITDQNTIGINILDQFIEELIPEIMDEIKAHYKPLPVIKSVRASHFSVNVAPSNTKLISALEGYGCRISQLSYRVE